MALSTIVLGKKFSHNKKQILNSTVCKRSLKEPRMISLECVVEIDNTESFVREEMIQFKITECKISLKMFPTF